MQHFGNLKVEPGTSNRDLSDGDWAGLEFFGTWLKTWVAVGNWQVRFQRTILGRARRLVGFCFGGKM